MSQTHPRWFTDSPDAGDPACLCSFCEQPIDEDSSPVLRAVDLSGKNEIRACVDCEGEFWVYAALVNADANPS
jgi:hypothetical protein